MMSSNVGALDTPVLMRPAETILEARLGKEATGKSDNKAWFSLRTLLTSFLILLMSISIENRYV